MKTAVKVASEASRRRQEWSLVIRGHSHLNGNWYPEQADERRDNREASFLSPLQPQLIRNLRQQLVHFCNRLIRQL
jgi:hypothetical protein